MDKAQLEPLVRSSVAAQGRWVRHIQPLRWLDQGFDYVHGRNIAANALDVIAVMKRMTPK